VRKVILIILAVLVVIAAALLVKSCRDDSDAYLVRAYFDNGGFVVPDVDVRVAGANVGSVKSIDVSMPGEVVGVDGEEKPGKAVVVMNITDKAFQDFREDASCIIRPQSLIGEKFVDCSVTQPRASGTEAPPELNVIPEGEPGAGQRMLPVQNNGKAVDQDLITNIYRLPYAQRFRIILNELGAGLATRGPELRETVTRANPTLMQVNRVLEKLSSQRKRLAQLAVDGEKNMTALAAKRKNMTGFFKSAGYTAAATAEREDDLRQNISNLPTTLVELRKTFNALGTFAGAAQPAFASLRPSVDQISELNTRIGPFARATERSLDSLGKATRTAGPDLVASRPIINKLGNLARQGKQNSTNLNFFLQSTRQADGYENLMKLIYNNASALNGFDQYGHYQRTNVVISGCTNYKGDYDVNCTADWSQDPSRKTASLARLPDLGSLEDELDTGDSLTGPTGATGHTGSTDYSDFATGATGADVESEEGMTGPTGPTGPAMRGRLQILDYLMSP
jgi:phospholipid/cholesterol/gamma-HCH transport system substrate-binding protein